MREFEKKKKDPDYSESFSFLFLFINFFIRNTTNTINKIGKIARKISNNTPAIPINNPPKIPRAANNRHNPNTIPIAINNQVNIVIIIRYLLSIRAFVIFAKKKEPVNSSILFEEVY